METFKWLGIHEQPLLLAAFNHKVMQILDTLKSCHLVYGTLMCLYQCKYIMSDQGVLDFTGHIGLEFGNSMFSACIGYM